MTIDLTQVITALLSFLVTGGGAGLLALAVKVRNRRREEQENEASGVAPGTGRRLDVAALAQSLAEKSVLQADQRVAEWRADATAARADATAARTEATAARAESADARAMTELLSRQLGQATQHIRDLEPLLRAAGVDVPPWPPDPEPGHPVMSHDRRTGDDDYDGPDRRRHTPTPTERTPHG